MQGERGNKYAEQSLNLILKISVAAAFVSLLSGCLEFQGPAWSPDGQSLAYTLYTRAPDAKINETRRAAFNTAVYLVNPDDDPLTPKLLADNAAFPLWTHDGQLYFLGERNEQGQYTKLMRLNGGAAQPEAALQGLRATAMQMAYDRAPIFLLMSGRSADPGSPVRAEIWNSESGKRTDLSALGQIYGPALSFNGRLLAYGSKPAEGHALLMLAELNGINAKEPVPIFPTNEAPEPSVTGFAVHAFPDSERFLFYGPGATSIWTTLGKPGAYKFSKIIPPTGVAAPVMAHISADSKTCAFTFPHVSAGKIGYDAYEYHFERAVWTKIEADSPVLVSGQVLDPKSKKTGVARKAWLSQSGLALGETAKPQVAPLTAPQLLAASALMLKTGDAEKALDFALKAQDAKPPPDDPQALNQALYKAYLLNKNFVRACDIFEQEELLTPVGPSGLRLIFPPASGLPQQPIEWAVAELRKMDELIAGAPENRMIPVLKEAFIARQKGEQRKAIELYQRAYDMCPDKARTGGTKFLQGMCELELGNLYPAAEFFDSTAKNDDFPQADFAASLASMSFLLNGKPETAAKAAAVMQLKSARKSLYAAEFAQLQPQARNKSPHEHGSTKESVSADGSAHAWAEFDIFWMPHVSTSAFAVEGDDGKPALRHMGLKRLAATSIWTHKSNTPIFRLAESVTQPQLSPSANLLAFTASGDVFPLRDNFCELFVLDTAGVVYAGNAAAASAGKTKGRQIIEKFSWDSESAVKIEGVEVDVFGGRKALEKTINIARGGKGN